MSVFGRLLNGSRGCTDLLACLYELNALETSAYFALHKTGGAKMEDLAAELERDRSTVYRAVKKLVDLHLAERETICMKGGGYYYVYHAASPERVRELIERRLDEFEAAVRARLDAFEDDVEIHTQRAAGAVETA